jgi:hypothetical protein
MRGTASIAILFLSCATTGICADDLRWSDPAALSPAPARAVGWPNRAADFDALPGFVKPPPGYGEVAFYWWMGDPLTRERLAWQLDRLDESRGVMGLQVNYAHSDRGGRSYGLTYPSQPPLFSEAWREARRARFSRDSVPTRAAWHDRRTAHPTRPDRRSPVQRRLHAAAATSQSGRRKFKEIDTQKCGMCDTPFPRFLFHRSV